MDIARDDLFLRHPDPLWIHDLQTLRLLAVNPAAVARYGFTEAEFLAMTVNDLEASQPGRHVLKDGRVIHVALTSTVVTVANGQAMLVAAQDVTPLVALQGHRPAPLARGESAVGKGAAPEAAGLLRLAGRLAGLGGWRVRKGDERVIWTMPMAGRRDVPSGQSQALDEVLECLVRDHRLRAQALLDGCLATGAPYDEVLHGVSLAGEDLWVRAIGEAERDDEGVIQAAVGAYQDVTELVEAREQRERYARRLEATLNSISDGFVLLDDQWRLIFVNRQAGRLLGREPAALLGANLWDEFPDAVGSEFESEYLLAVETGRRRSFTGYYAAVKAWFQVNVYPTREGLAVYLSDITELKRVQETVRVSEERFRLVARASNDLIWDWDLATDRVWRNDSLQPQFGYDPEAAAPRMDWWLERVDPDDRDRVMATIREAIAGDGKQWRTEYRFHKADGTVATVEDRGFLMRDQNGRATRMLGSMVDVTAQREMQARLQQAQRLEAVGQLTGGVAHDFNNLLTVVLGNCEMLTEQLADDPRLGRLAAMTVSAAEHGARLTNRLLAFARRQALQPVAVSINQLIADMEDLLRRTLGEDIDIEVLPGEGLWSAHVDPGQLEVALLNLMLNARDAMPGGGQLSIETRNTVLDGTYAAEHEELTPGEFCLISVTDNGVGMTPAVLARVYEPFFTTKDVGRGSGLGLSMVYGFTKQSGGHIKIYSEAGVGTTVKLYLPRDGEPGAGLVAPARSAPETRGGDEHVLVVEDDELAREYLTSQLVALGYQVTAAASGPEALDLLNRLPWVDLLFTDVVMPGGMNGRQLADQVRQMRPGTRVLFTSGYPESAIAHQGRLEPGVHLLSKPYRRQELAAKVRSALDG